MKILHSKPEQPELTKNPSPIIKGVLIIIVNNPIMRVPYRDREGCRSRNTLDETFIEFVTALKSGSREDWPLEEPSQSLSKC